MRRSKYRLVALLIASSWPALAQENAVSQKENADNPQSAPQIKSEPEATKTLPNLAPRAAWPSPVDDEEKLFFGLFDLLEYQRIRDFNAVRWDFLGWYGGDRQRWWIKSEGEQYSRSGAGGEADLQALYGKLISPFFDLQAGARVETHFEQNAKVTRGFAVIGLQGLSPYRFDLEPALFLSTTGKVSGRATASYDLLATQRLILQPRAETEFAFQEDRSFGVNRGFNDVEVGLRIRYEVRREFAPYFGVSWRRSFDLTAARVQREGGLSSQVEFVFGVRAWR